MFATLFTATLLMAALFCAGMVVRTYRDPANWHLGEESLRPEFHSWSDIGIFCAIAILCLIFGGLGIAASN